MRYVKAIVTLAVLCLTAPSWTVAASLSEAGFEAPNDSLQESPVEVALRELIPKVNGQNGTKETIDQLRDAVGESIEAIERVEKYLAPALNTIRFIKNNRLAWEFWRRVNLESADAISGLEKMGSKIESMVDEIRKLEQSLDQLDQRVEAFVRNPEEKTFFELTRAAKKERKVIERASSDVSEVADQFQDIDGMVSGVQRGLHTIGSGITEKVPKLADPVNKSVDLMDKVAEATSKTNAELEALGSGLQALEESMTELAVMGPKVKGDMEKWRVLERHWREKEELEAKIADLQKQMQEQTQKAGTQPLSGR